MDDDVTVEPTWLQNLTSGLDEAEWSGAGGRTLPTATVPLPFWLSLDGPLGDTVAALFDQGDKPGELDRPPFGTNMAFRKEMFQKYGGFRTDLGPRPGDKIRNEDTEFGRRLMAAGERIRYEPSAVVYHPLPADRLKKEYFLESWFDLGRALVREVGRRADVWGIPRPYLSILKTGILLPGRTLGWMLTWKPQRRFYRKCRVWMTAGVLVEFYRIARDVRRLKGVVTPKIQIGRNPRT